MNERIKLLAKNHLMHESWTSYGESIQEDYYEFYPEDLEKFAELIVRECEKVSLKSSHRDDDMGAIIARQIKQHFGVE